MSIAPENLTFYGLDRKLTRVTLPRPLEFELVKSFDSPAHSFEADFPCERAYPEFFHVELWDGQTRLFRGFVDEQTVTENDCGWRLRLIARSRGSLLLDNEARPTTYQNVDLQDIFDNHIRPYGFSELDAESLPLFNVYPVLKGTSEWEVFYNFFRNSGRGTVYIDDENKVVCRQNHNTGVIHSISNRDSAAMRYSSLKIVNNRYSPVTEYVIRDQAGAYSYSYQNPDQATGLTRRRYLIPPGEFMDASYAGWNEASLRIRRSMLGKQVITATIPGYQTASLCDRVNLDTGLCRYDGLFVHQLRWKLSAAGVSTAFTLIDPQYI